MIRTVALLAVVASASAMFGTSKWLPGLSCTFNINPLTWGTSSFVNLPRNSTAAKEKGWTIVEKPTKSYSSGYDALVLLVDPDDPTIGVLTDENGQTSGTQYAIPKTGFSSCYDMVEQGFTSWNYTNADGEIQEFWAISQYFAPEDAETRKASYNETLVLRGDNIMVEGNNGELVPIATNLNNTDSVWTEQACVVLMGLHYYYNMTETLSCDKPLFPWFALYSFATKQLIGTGMMTFGSTNSSTFENPGRAAVKYIVPTCPDCMLDQVDSYGAITRHTYFINAPTTITC